MTKKNYIVIAEAIARTIIVTNENGKISADYLIDELALEFQIDNHNFNKQKFYDYIVEKSTPNLKE